MPSTLALAALSTTTNDASGASRAIAVTSAFGNLRPRAR